MNLQRFMDQQERLHLGEAARLEHILNVELGTWRSIFNTYESQSQTDETFIMSGIKSEVSTTIKESISTDSTMCWYTHTSMAHIRSWKELGVHKPEITWIHARVEGVESCGGSHGDHMKG